MNASDDTTGGNTGGASPASNEDFGRKPGFQDNDAAMAAMLAVAAATPDSKHQADEESARRWLQSPEAQAVMGLTADSPLLVPDTRVFTELQKADPAQPAGAAVADATDRAVQGIQAEQSELAAAEAARQAAGPASRADAGANASPTGAPSRPMELETQLASIQMSAGRELRMAIQGDEAIKIKFYARLEAMGKLRYQGGTPVLNMSMKEMAKVLQDVAEKNGAVFQPVAQLEFSRARGGLMNDVVGGIKDALGRQHQVQVFVVGEQSTVDKKVAEVSAVLTKMQSEGLLDASSTKNFKDGVLQVEPGKLVELKGSAMLDELVGEARATVHAHRKHESELDQARKDFKNKETDDKMASAAAKQAGASAAEPAKADVAQSSVAGSPAAGQTPSAPQAPAVSSAPQTPVSPYVQKAVDGMADGFSEMGKLSAQPEGKKQIVAESLLNQVRTFNAKDAGELNKLSPEARQTFVTQLALTAAMADTGTFGRKLNSEIVDRAYEADPAKNRAASPSIREKVGQLVEAERGDPQFEARATAVLHDLESKGIITREQASKAYETLAPGKEFPEPVKAADSAQAKSDAGASADAPSTAGSADAKAASPKEGEASAQNAQDAASKADAPAVAEGAKPEVSQAQSAQRELPLEQPAAQGSVEQNIKPAEAHTASDVSAAQPSAEQTAPKASETAAAAQPVSDAEKATSPVAQSPSAESAASTGAGAETAASEAGAKPPVKVSALVEKIDALVKAGPQALSREDASSVIASLEGRQASKLVSLDGRGGNQPTQTLERIDGLLKEVASGRHGDELAAAARNLGDALNKWKGQDAQRLSKDHGLDAQGLDALRGSLRREDGAWHGAGKDAGASAEGKATGESSAALAGEGVKSEAKAPSQAAAGAEQGGSDAAKAAAAERYNQTEMAAGKLAAMMNNPAGAFTNKDKTWNERNVDAAVNAVLRMDVDAARTMSANQRNQIAAYAAWVADNANSGRLPGFTGPEGQARAQELTARATALVGVASGKMPAGVTAQLTKADRMVGALQQRAMAAPRRSAGSMGAASQMSGRTSANTASQKGSATAANPMDASKFARDLGHAVFKEASMTEPYAKYLLKNASVLTSDVMKTLSPADRAQAAVGLAHLAQEVRSGALGEFKDLSPTLQRQVVGAQQVANKLQTELSANPENRVALAKAFMDLQSPASDKSAQAGTQAPQKAAPTATPKAPEATSTRNMDR